MIFIIVIIASIWFLFQLLSYSFEVISRDQSVQLTDNEVVSKEVSYLEKIDHFSLQEFDENNQLSHLVEAKNYFNFKHEPALLLEPQVTTYNDIGKPDYILSSERAHYLESGEIQFKGNVDLHAKNGATHKMYTEELLVGTKTDDLISNKPVTYLAEKGEIDAQGMYMQTKEDKMQLTGKTQINQNTGAKILTKDLFVDQSDGQKHYYSKDDTTYLGKGNKVYAKGIDLDMNKELMQLLGKVKILQNTGSKINTQDLLVDQSDDGEVYTTKERIHYQSKVADIRAKGMHYDTIKQKIRLTGGVKAYYE